LGFFSEDLGVNEAAKPRAMKILLASLPFEGHLPPVAALGQELHKQGHQVQLWTAPKALQTLERLAPGA
jgi:UDP:flavonoid glycosyltransferase YjiC (YdhE family)